MHMTLFVCASHGLHDLPGHTTNPLQRAVETFRMASDSVASAPRDVSAPKPPALVLAGLGALLVSWAGWKSPWGRSCCLVMFVPGLWELRDLRYLFLAGRFSVVLVIIDCTPNARTLLKRW